MTINFILWYIHYLSIKNYHKSISRFHPFNFFSLPLISVNDDHGPYSNGGKFKCKPGILPPKNFVYYKDSLTCGGSNSKYHKVTFIIPSVVIILMFLTSTNTWRQYEAATYIRIRKELLWDNLIWHNNAFCRLLVND